MAFTDVLVWEIRTAGSDANGGAFDPITGVPGTDFSQQDSAQFSYTDIVIDATTNTDCTSAARPFTSVDVGNIIKITSGTGFTVQSVLIKSVTAGVARMDKSLGTLGSTGGTGNLGGAKGSPGEVAGLIVTDNIIYVKSGTYTIGSGTVNTSGNKIDTTVSGYWIGYETTRGDYGTKPVFSTAQSSLSIFRCGVGASHVRNLKVAQTAGTSTKGFECDGAGTTWLLCEAADIAGPGFDIGGINQTLVECEAHGCTTNSGQFNVFNSSSMFIRCIARNSGAGTPGFNIGEECYLEGCIADTNTISGFTITSFSDGSVLVRCISYNNTEEGFGTTTGATSVVFDHCIAEENGSNGFDVNQAPVTLINCAGYNNTSGNVAGITPTVNINFQNLTVSAFVDAVSNDFNINNTSGGGAVLRVITRTMPFSA